MAWPGARRTYAQAGAFWPDCGVTPDPSPLAPPLVFPSGYAVLLATSALSSPAPLPPRMLPGMSGLLPAGVDAGLIGAEQRTGYIPASTPDGRIARLGIGRSPIGWRRPYHGTIILGSAPGQGETETR